MITAEVHRIPEVAEVIAQIPGVSEVYSTTGEFDLVAIVRVRAHEGRRRGHPRQPEQGVGRHGNADPHRVPHLLQA